MNSKIESPKNWPEGVPLKLDGYQKPLFTFLDDSAEKYPQQVFTIFQGATRTYSQIKEAAEKVAGFLQKMGVAKGDRVAIFLPNIPQFPEIFL